MSHQHYNPTDLASVLQTLSALSNPIPSQPDLPDDDPYEPSDSLSISSSSPTIPQRPPEPFPNRSTLHHKARANADSSTVTVVDTSSVSTWPAALRHVMRLVSQSEDVQRRVRWLIQRQHDHEKQWWRGREALVKKQKARVEKKKEMDEVLRSVGAPVDSTKQISTVEEDEAELKRYDAKVYTASKQMAEAMAAELRGLQIPFFSIKPALVTDSSNSDPSPPSSETLSPDELSALQRRMLELLQDLCKE
ncbi:hypothetical protein EYZ11_008970 [Aspergillus tanneri]|uniref:Uncharacterized protein n=1 Tax=Aspergillus tanneri TaxID=1220188 RepID=A0A4S3J9K2_9EURO|nr:uncharacterized protein ATNIH1004_011078 [Aspergillus tanneri]KAA8642137.1 hypothetical protein ATNIH1004_011078 [Aspergillus tanneri]THC91575.1 hypothetical protein EYZ11_008970 [Aspergillus tanneri]